MNDMKKLNISISTIPMVIAIALTLAACGEKSKEVTKNVAPTDKAQEPKKDPILEPVFALPSKYKNYNHMVMTVITNDDMRKYPAKYPESLYDTTKAAFISQVGSSDKPDWFLVAAMRDRSLLGVTNDFKRQEAGEKAKADFKVDPSSLNIVVGTQGKQFLGKPDITTGVYKIQISSDLSVGYSMYEDIGNNRYDTGYEYKIDYKELGIWPKDCPDCVSKLSMYVKVPLDKAKQIEELREVAVGSDDMRVYGKLSGITESHITPYRTSGTLKLNAEAIEFGAMKNGEWVSYFFVDGDELKKAAIVKSNRPVTFHGI